MDIIQAVFPLELVHCAVKPKKYRMTISVVIYTKYLQMIVSSGKIIQTNEKIYSNSHLYMVNYKKNFYYKDGR